MLTGALILPKTYEIYDFLKRRLSRILIPFLFWSIMYIILNVIIKLAKDENMSLIELSKYILVNLRDGASFHFWYIYMLIGIYLFIPLIGKWINFSPRKEILYFLIIWGITILINLPKIDQIKPDIDLSYFSGFIGYPILGYYLAIKNKNIKDRRIAILLIAIGALITIVGTYVGTTHKGAYYDIFYGYLSPNAIITSIGIFLLFRHLEFKNNRLNSAIAFVGRYSYGIYLCHIFVMVCLSTIGINSSLLSPIVSILLTSVLCFIISLLVTYTINKIPYGHFVSG